MPNEKRCGTSERKRIKDAERKRIAGELAWLIRDQQTRMAITSDDQIHREASRKSRAYILTYESLFGKFDNASAPAPESAPQGEGCMWTRIAPERHSTSCGRIIHGDNLSKWVSCLNCGKRIILNPADAEKGGSTI